MAGVTFKCLNCGNSLKFNPDDQKWKCDFCGSIFDEQTLLAKAVAGQYRLDSPATFCSFLQGFAEVFILA